MVNYLGFEHYRRWDFSRDKKYALSDKTKRFLDSLKGKLRITVFFSPNTPITDDVQNLLTEYQYAAKGKIDVEHIDPERNLSRAKELFDKYKVVTDESMLMLDYEGRNKTVKASEMAEVDQSGMAMGEGPRVTAFKGEQAITQRDHRPDRREEKHHRLCARPQGTAHRDSGSQPDDDGTAPRQPDLGAEDVYRK